MIRARACSLLLAAWVALFGGHATAGSAERLALSWLAMTETCLAYAESGERARAFGGWHVAAEGGGVCNSDPACERDQMTFIGEGALGMGAVTVAVGAADWASTDAVEQETRIADKPAHLSCVSAPGIRHQTSDIAAVHRDWVAAARQSGRFVEGGVFAGFMSGPYLGCGYDGRAYQIEFSLHETGPALFRLYFPARETGAEGTGPECGRVMG